jgi:predicted nucleic acid-binding protein
MNLVVADSSPLIAFARSGHLELLRRVAGTIHVPHTVWQECVYDLSKPGAQCIQKAVSDGLITCLPDPGVPASLGVAPIDAGERAAIALAIEQQCPILLDERLGRIVARRHHIAVIGSAGILLAAKAHGLIPAVGPILKQWISFGYRLSSELMAEVLRRANEES